MEKRKYEISKKNVSHKKLKIKHEIRIETNAIDNIGNYYYLPNELIEYILLYLDNVMIINIIQLLCKYFYGIVNTSKFWKHRYLNLSFKRFRSISSIKSILRLDKFKEINSICIGNTNIELKTLNGIYEVNKNIKAIKLNENVTYKTTKAINAYFLESILLNKNLISISVYYVRSIYPQSFDGFQFLMELCVENLASGNMADMIFYLKFCKNLKLLELGFIINKYQKCKFNKFAKFCPVLEHIKLTGQHMLGGDDLVLLTKYNNKLKSLQIFDCLEFNNSNLIDIINNCKQLQLIQITLSAYHYPNSGVDMTGLDLITTFNIFNISNAINVPLIGYCGIGYGGIDFISEVNQSLSNCLSVVDIKVSTMVNYNKRFSITFNSHFDQFKNKKLIYELKLYWLSKLFVYDITSKYKETPYIFIKNKCNILNRKELMDNFINNNLNFNKETINNKYEQLYKFFHNILFTDFNI